MKKVFIINGAPKFAHSGGEYNKTITEWSIEFFRSKGYNVKYTDINNGYDIQAEIDKFVWADIVVYHTPIWWFQLPSGFKRYFDEVLTDGHQNGIYFSDGRRSTNPTRNYGTGGLLFGKKYMLTTTWNAPIEAFTIEDEFFNKTSEDDGVMFGFHKMNAFIGMKPLPSFHFHDVQKNPKIEDYRKRYLEHLENVFG